MSKYRRVGTDRRIYAYKVEDIADVAVREKAVVEFKPDRN